MFFAQEHDCDLDSAMAQRKSDCSVFLSNRQCIKL